MASSDDEGDTVPYVVSNYHFVDENEEPISFAELPIQWCDAERPEGNQKQIFLHGTADNGLQKLYKQVTAWKFDLSGAKPEISMLTKENNWIKLQRPRKSFEAVIRTILITIHCLQFLKKNPEASGKSMWDHLAKVFSLYEVRPSENDLVDHIPIVSEAVERDESLKTCKLLLTFLKEKPRKRKEFDELGVQPTSMDGFIVDDIDDTIDDSEEEGSDEEGDMYDSVCAFCDNGGELLCCEGKCLRSFHATREAGKESVCDSLGMTDDQVKAMKDFLCKNCQHNQHQCFACGKLGPSDKSAGAEVFECVNATCGHFYHPQCVAKWLHREDEGAAEELKTKIAAGEPFICPVHKCSVCKQIEDKDTPELQFAVCRRCPKSYHKKCLPRKIAFEDLEEEGIMQRAWEGLLPNRILIYCLKHEIDEEIGTPVRNHIIFQRVEEKKKIRASDLPLDVKKGTLKRKSLAPAESPQGRTGMKMLRKVESSPSAVKEGSSLKRIVKKSSADSLRKIIGKDASKKSLRDNNKAVQSKAEKSPVCEKNKISLGDKLYDVYKNKGSEHVKPKKQDLDDSDHEQVETVRPAMKKLSSSSYELDADSERRLLALMEESASSITLDQIKEKHKAPSTHAQSSKYVVDKVITQGRVDGAVEALRTALQRLEAGCSIQDAKAVCEPEILNQLVKWKNKLKVYLAPFLHGMRYTSYGRHFTKVGKLEEIVEKVHGYVQNGDTIVDFCCGANDFSCLMKRKLEGTGKKCFYKNYDILTAKNDFNFEQRDWMGVQPKELPNGSQLIMGLNPPFGVHASLANKFIDKALKFKPKLLILIVPQETERLDKKKTPYDLIWEDDELLMGKSFYLPGSIDENDKQMGQWNNNAPPLYLWSRRDWTAKHKAIALKHGHLSRLQSHHDTQVLDHPLEDHCGHDDNPMLKEDYPVHNDEQEALKTKSVLTENHIGNSPYDNGDHVIHSHEKRQFSEKSNKSRHVIGLNRSGVSEVSSVDRQSVGRTPMDDVYRGTPHHCIPDVNNGRSSPEGEPFFSHEMPMDIEEDGYQHLQPIHDSGLQFGVGYDDAQASLSDRRYGLNVNQPYTSGTQRWSSGASPVADTLGYRPHMGQMDERFGRDSELRANIQQFGRHDSSTQRSSYLPGRDPGFGHMSSLPSTYGHHLSAAQPSYSRMNTSVMQHYAPRLDELNHTRMNSLGHDPPMGSGNGVYDPRRPPPRLGFAPGPHHHAFSHQSSSGWLNE